MVDVKVLVAVPTVGGASPVDKVPWVVAGAKQPDGGQVRSLNSILLRFFTCEKMSTVQYFHRPDIGPQSSRACSKNEFLR